MEIITLEQYITASGKYPERLQSEELTQELKDNAIQLLNKVNQFLEEVGVKEATVSSGFRPSNVNAALPNSAKKSNHMICKAVDIYDPDGKLDELFMANIETMEKYGIFLESPKSTPSWAHLQIVKTHNNPFIP